MSDKKSWGETVLGWFVERDGDTKAAPEPPGEAAPKREPSPKREPPPPVELKGELPAAPSDGAPFDFPAVFRAAGIPAEAQGRVQKAATLLGTLPAEASREVKRQIALASLKAFGYPVEQILEAAAAEVRALQVFVQFSERQSQQAVADANQRIEALTREIEETRRLIEQKLTAQQQLGATCSEERRRVEEVLAFFGEEAGAPAADPPATQG